MSAARADRRRAQKLADAVDRITQGDAKFFERFPDREYRIRIAAQVELEQNAMLDKTLLRMSAPEHRWFTIVRQIAPGVRVRA